MIRFSETTLFKGEGRIGLLNAMGEMLIEIEGHELEDAVRTGFLDPTRLHHSLFEFWRIRLDVSESMAEDDEPQTMVERFLNSLDIPGSDETERRSA